MSKFLLYLFQVLTVTLAGVSMFLPEYPERFLIFVLVGNLYIVFLTSEITKKDLKDGLGKVLVGFVGAGFVMLLGIAYMIYKYKLAIALLYLVGTLLEK